MSDHYAVLGVQNDATPDQIRDAYFRLIRQLNAVAEFGPAERAMLGKVQKAFDVLSDPLRRGAYDNRAIAAEGGPEDIQIKVRYSRSNLPASVEPQHHYVVFDIECLLEARPENAPPFHLALVIDRSTSMQGARIDMVRSTLKESLASFRPADLFTLVAFSDRAEVLTEMKPAAEIDIEAICDRLTTSGGTEIFQGLHAGFQELQKTPPGIIRQMILLTDGHTYGDDGACMELAQRMKGEGITLSAMGIGHDWNDQLLDRVCGISGGNAVLISSTNDLSVLLRDRLKALNTTYASDVTLEFSTDPGVELSYAMRMIPDAVELETSSPMQLGALLYQKSIRVVLEFAVQPQGLPRETIHLLTGKLSLSLPGVGEDLVEFPLDFSRPMIQGQNRESPPVGVVEEVGKMSLFRLQDRIRHDVNEGQIDKATRHLHYLATHLLTRGDRELAHTVLLEAEHIQQSRRFSKEGDKRIKYGTRVLLQRGTGELK